MCANLGLLMILQIQKQISLATSSFLLNYPNILYRLSSNPSKRQLSIISPSSSTVIRLLTALSAGICTF